MRAIELLKKTLGVKENANYTNDSYALQRSIFGSTLEEEQAYWAEIERQEAIRQQILAEQKLRIEQLRKSLDQ